MPDPFPELTRVVEFVTPYLRPPDAVGTPGVIPSTLAADLAAVVARCERVTPANWDIDCNKDHEGLLWCLDQIGHALEQLDAQHPGSRSTTPPMMWVEWLHCVISQRIVAVRARTIEECAVLVEAVAIEHRRADKELNDRVVAEGGKRYRACGEEGYFCEDFGCGSFIDLAARLRALLPTPAPATETEER